MNRGSTIRNTERKPKPSGFNEAPIHESGKYRDRRAARRDGSRFNEAPIHESGKFRRTIAAGAVGGSASMRPRFMNRGSAWDLTSVPSRFRRFNEAPIHESGKSWDLTSVPSRFRRFNEAPIHESGKSRPSTLPRER